jgi:hypothetical protein
MGRTLEGAAWLLDAAIGFGFVSGVVVDLAFGKFFLGGLFAAFALAVYVRSKRKQKVNK